jgi:uncharacterized transporter YbjL
MLDLLAENPTLLLFVVAGLGFLVGRVRIGDFSLGVSAVLFAGIAVGALDPRLQLPEPVWVLGLVVFVYTVGLSSGPGFVAALRRRGLAANLIVPRCDDLIAVVGAETAVDEIVAVLGDPSDEHLVLDRRDFDSPRLFVSSPDIAGRRLGELELATRFGATVTRVRRGDVDLLADEDTVLELGDRVQVVAPRARMQALSRLFGDSYRALGEIDVLTFSLGIALGLLLGSVPLPLPGGDTFTRASPAAPSSPDCASGPSDAPAGSCGSCPTAPISRCASWAPSSSWPAWGPGPVRRSPPR